MYAHFQIIRGLPCPASPSFTRKNIEDAMDFIPGDGDLIIASYPKTGSTWLIYIILQIKSRGQLYPSIDDMYLKKAPYLALYGSQVVEQGDKPKVYRQHFPYNYVKKNNKSKCIYIYRHPEDTVVSFYHFDRSVLPDITGEFDEFFNDFVTGNMRYGSYFQHVLSFYEHRNDDNLLMVSYEKLYANRRDEILKIANFLGEEYYQNLVDDGELFRKVMERTSFDYMKKSLHMTNFHAKTEVRTEVKPKVNFFRKGIVGDGKTALTDTQCQQLKDAAGGVLNGSSIMDEWYCNDNNKSRF